MRFHGGAVDQNLGRWAVSAGKGMEQVAPDALVDPADKAVVEGLARAIDIRSIDPASAGLQNMNYAADHLAVIDPLLAPRTGRQMRLDPPELLFCQLEIIPIYK